MTSKRANTRASVWRRGSDGKWGGRVQAIDPDTGLPRTITATANTRAEVLARLDEKRANLTAGRPMRDSRTTLADAARRWLAVTLPVSGRAQTSRDLYAGDVARFLLPAEGKRRTGKADAESIKLGPIALADLTTSHVEAALLVLERAGYSVSVRRRFLTVVRMILATAVRDRLIGRNVADALDRPKEARKEARSFTPADVDALLGAVRGERIEPLVIVLVSTGLRSGEARGLRWENVDLDAGQALVTGTLVPVKGGGLVMSEGKGRARRVIPLLPVTVAALRAWRATQATERLAYGPGWQDTGYVFTTPKGTPMDPANARKQFAAAVKRAKVEGTQHSARHAFASALLADGESARTVADVMGHSRTATTLDTYGHVLPEHQAAAVKRLERLYSLGGGA